MRVMKSLILVLALVLVIGISCTFTRLDPVTDEEISQKTVLIIKVSVKGEIIPVKSDRVDGISQQRVLVNKDATLRNSIVYIKSGLGMTEFETPKDSVQLEIKDYMFRPQVFGIQVGQEMKIINRDRAFHNAHFKGKKNKRFNMVTRHDEEETLKFSETEFAMFVCDIHETEEAFFGIFTHPYFFVSGTKSTFEWKGLSPGNYEIEAWHEKLGIVSQSVKISKGSTSTLDLTFTIDEK